MARIALRVADPARRLTLKVMLESDGLEVGDDAPDAVICDDPRDAREQARERPALLLASFQDLREAVAAMAAGVYGYIVVPFVPGEAPLMVRRALEQRVKFEDAPLRPLEEVEAEYIETALRRARYKRGEAARLLGIGRNTLWRKLKKWQDKHGR